MIIPGFFNVRIFSSQMIRDQYSKPKEAMDFSETPFQFAASSEFLKIRLEYQPSANGWRVAFQNSQQVKMSLLVAHNHPTLIIHR